MVTQLEKQKQQAGRELGATLDKANDILGKQGKQIDPGRVSADQMSGEAVVTATNNASNKIEPVISASELVNPTGSFAVPEPTAPTAPTGGLKIANNVSRDLDGFISAQTEEAKQLRDLQKTYASFSQQGDLSDLFTTTQAQFGVTPETLKELKDINLQLADMDTASGLTKVGIAGAAGQTVGQAGRELTQEDREASVRSMGLAARAAVLQGNIETANQIARDTVNTAYQDRTLQATNILNQIDMAQGQVDEQTAQLLEQEKRVYEAELANIQEVKDSVANAMVSGATQSEISRLNDQTVSDADKLALANSITARGATELRGLDIQEKEASIRASNALTNERYYNSLITRAEAGDADALSELGLATDSVDSVGIYAELENSAGGKPLPSGAVVSLEKAVTVASQLNTLASLFQDDKQLRGLTDPDTGESLNVDLAPITKTFRSNNPFDVKAQQITASINAIVPNLARGIYGEVGVLTDQDVARYAQTIPNLGSVEEVQDAMLALTLKTVQNSVKNKLVINARNGADVSGQTATLEELERTVGQAMLPLNQKTSEYQALVDGGANPTEIDSLLTQGYQIEDVISYYTGQ